MSGPRLAALAAVAVLVVHWPAIAHADRNAVLGVGASAMGGGTDIEREQINGLRFGVHLALEQTRPDMPVMPGYATAWSLVPEVMVARWRASDPRYADDMALAGARIQFDVTQNRMGLLGISAYTGLYLAGRAGMWTSREK